MVNFKFKLANPYSDRWIDIYNIGGYLTDNKSWEIEVLKTSAIVEVTINFTTRSDHAGLAVKLGLFGFNVNLSIRDNRHWDYENKCWVKYE